MQDFRHASQKGEEAVSDFIRRLERTFRIAYGRNGLSSETRSALLYAQLQEGLKYDLMRAPAISGALSYAELCIAAKNEERRLAGLRKRQSYHNKPDGRRPDKPNWKPPASNQGDDQASQRKPGAFKGRCHKCNKQGHLARDCRQKKTESPGKPQDPPSMKQVQAPTGEPPGAENPTNYLDSSSEGESVRLIRIKDNGSASHCARVVVQGVPVYGIILISP